MVAETLIELARRKERLIARAENQRTEIAAAFERWRKPAGVLDRGIAVAEFLRAHPVLLAAGLAAAAALGRRNLMRWVASGMIAWRAWRSVQGWVRRFNF